MSTSTTAPLLRVRGIRREFAAGEQTLVVLDGVDLDIHAGELVAIVGQSGSGKSTLMNILGCLDRPSAGAYQIAGRETAQMSPDELAELRREHFGFADEPTGALDTHSGREVMKILGELHAEGHTVVLVTHDMAVAEHAQRIIEVRDGRVVDDRATGRVSAVDGSAAAPPQRGGGSGWQAVRDRFTEAFRMALRAMNAHRMRTFLTMLGIIIGIASVVSVVALGTGARQAILSNISSLGTNTIEIYPGSGFGDLHSARVERPSRSPPGARCSRRGYARRRHRSRPRLRAPAASMRTHGGRVQCRPDGSLPARDPARRPRLRSAGCG